MWHMLVGVGVACLDIVPSVCTHWCGAESVGARKRCQFGARTACYQLVAEKRDWRGGSEGDRVRKWREKERERQGFPVLMLAGIKETSELGLERAAPSVSGTSWDPLRCVSLGDTRWMVDETACFYWSTNVIVLMTVITVLSCLSQCLSNLSNENCLFQMWGFAAFRCFI